MTHDDRYACTAAVADLNAAGLLDDVLLYRGGAWIRLPAMTSDLDDALGADAFQGAVLDSRRVVDDVLFVGLDGEHVDGRDFVGPALRAGAAAALTRPWDAPGADPLLSGDPGRPAVVLLSRDPEAALTELASHHAERMAVPTLGVTGSNGKTTTKDMAAALLATLGPTHATGGNLNNELGVPLTLLGLTSRHRWAVVEMGASRAGDIDALAALARPAVGVITNASGAHLEGFGDLATIVRTKGELLDHLPADGTAILNRDSEGFDAWRDRALCPVVSWGTGPGEHCWDWTATSDGGGSVSLGDSVWTLPLPGRHNGANFVAALLAVRALSGEEPDVAVALAGLRTSDHRSRLLTIDGVLVLDDAYNANPESVTAAGRALRELPGDGRAVAVLGRMAELGPASDDLHANVGRGLADAGLDAVWAVGVGAAALADGAAAAGAEGRAFDDVASAVRHMETELVAGDRVLVKGSRSARMERIIDRFRARREPDMSNLERA